MVEYKIGDKTFHIYRSVITIKSQTITGSKIYGDAWTPAELACTLTYDAPLYGSDQVNYTQRIFTKYGENRNEFDVTVDRGGRDVSDEYKIKTAWGTVFIEKRVITLTAGSASKDYDGTPLTCDTYVLTDGSLATGDHITIVTFEEDSVVEDRYAVAENIISSVTIMRGQTNVSDCYHVKKINGTLIIN